MVAEADKLKAREDLRLLGLFRGDFKVMHESLEERAHFGITDRPRNFAEGLARLAEKTGDKETARRIRRQEAQRVRADKAEDILRRMGRLN